MPQQFHLDLTVQIFTGLDAQHPCTLRLGARLLEDRSGDNEEALRVYAEPADIVFCMFGAEPECSNSSVQFLRGRLGDGLGLTDASAGHVLGVRHIRSGDGEESDGAEDDQRERYGHFP